jgi:hypothetical protein
LLFAAAQMLFTDPEKRWCEQLSHVCTTRTWLAEKFPVVNRMIKELLPAPDSPSVHILTGLGWDIVTE